MDYRDIKIEDGIVTMPLDNFNKIESEIDKLMTRKEFWKNEYNAEAKQGEKTYTHLNKLADNYRVLEHKLRKAEDKVRIYECIERDGYVVFSYESTDCDGTRAEGYEKCYSYKHVESMIEGLYDNAEGRVGFEVITKNVKNYKDESERRIYGGWC
jgi:hypothetical protein